MLSEGIQYINANRVNHWVKISGSSRNTCPIVVLHGGPGGNQYVFERTVGKELEKRTTVIYYEQRGCGRSEQPKDKNFSIEVLIDDLRYILDYLELERVHLLGYSFGAELALEFAVKHPIRVDKLVLQCPSDMSDFKRIYNIQLRGFKAIVNEETRKKIESIEKKDISILEKYDSVWALMDAETVDMFLFKDLQLGKWNRSLWVESGLVNTGEMAKEVMNRKREKPLLEDIKILSHECLVIVGQYDKNVGLDLPRDISLNLKNSRLSIYNESAHFPDIEETDKYVQEVLGFVLE